LLERDLFPFYHTYKNKSEYKKIEAKVDKSLLNKERVYISGYDVILFYGWYFFFPRNDRFSR